MFQTKDINSVAKLAGTASATDTAEEHDEKHFLDFNREDCTALAAKEEDLPT